VHPLVLAATLFTGAAAALAVNAQAPVDEGTKQSAPARQLMDLAGQPASIEDYQRELLVIDFWATWCLPCIFQTRLLNEFHANMDPRVALVGIAVDEDREAVLKFLAEHRIDYPVLVGNETIAAEHGVIGYPTIVIRKADGTSRIGHVGVVEPGDLEQMIDSMLPGGRGR